MRYSSTLCAIVIGSNINNTNILDAATRLLEVEEFVDSIEEEEDKYIFRSKSTTNVLYASNINDNNDDDNNKEEDKD